MDEAEMKGLKVCSESMVVSVDMAQLASKVELRDEKVQDMAKLVEVMTEVLVETGDWTNWSASWMEPDSSFFPSYKVQTGSLPAEVETEGAACSESAKSLSSWAHAIVEKTACQDVVLELVREARCGCAQALEIGTGRNPPWLTKRKCYVGPLRMQEIYRKNESTQVDDM